MWVRIAYLAMVLAFTATAVAQSTSSLEGKLLEKSGAPLASAHMTLSSGGHSQSAETDAHGYFRFAVVSAGECTLTAEAPGYFKQDSQILLKPRQARSITITLFRKTQVDSNVNVTANVTDLDTQQTGTGRVLTRHDLQQMPAPLTKDVTTLALNVAPGAVASHDNFVHVRGNELSLHEFINGVSFLDNAHQHFTPGISPEIFQSVNVITGGFPAEFGNRFGGVLDITTRSGRDVHGHGSVTLGLGTVKNNSATAEYGGGKGKFGYYLFAGGFSSNRFLNPVTPNEIHDFGTGERVAVQLDYQGTSDMLKLLATGGRTDFELPDTPDQQSAGRNSSRILTSQTAILNWQHVFSTRTVLSTSAYQRTVSDHLFPTTDPTTEYGLATRNTQTLGIKSDLTVAWRGQTIKGGVDLTRLRLLENFSFNPRGEETALGSLSFAGSKVGRQSSLYLQDHFSPFANFTVDAGVRWDEFHLLQTNAQVSPRVGIAYHIAKTGSVLHAAYNRFFTPPPIEYALLAAHLGTESGFGIPHPYVQNYYEVGWTQQLTKQTLLELSAYRHTGRNSFENTELGITRLFVPTNYGSARARGAELALTMRQLQRIGLSGRLQYAVAQVDFFGPVTGGFSDEQIEPGERVRPVFDQRHTATASLYYSNQWQGFWAATNLRYGSGTPAVINATEVQLPQNFVADFALGARLWQKELQALSLELDVLNASDNRFQIAKESESTPIQYAPRRALSAQLKWRF